MVAFVRAEPAATNPVWSAQVQGHFEVTKVDGVSARLVPTSPFCLWAEKLDLKGLILGGSSRIFYWAVEKHMSLNYRDKKYDASAARMRESGFSMVELMIVCVIMILIAGL